MAYDTEFITICTVCGEEFYAKTKRAKYCCAKCKNHSRYTQSAEERKEKSKKIEERAIELYTSGMSIKSISDTVNKSYTFVQTAIKKAGLPKQLTNRQKQVAELRAKRLCSTEIADILGIRSNEVRTIANRIGMPFTDEETQKSIALGKEKALLTQCGTHEERRARQKEYIDKNHPKFEYISGYVNSDSFMKLKCKCCGTVIEKSAITIRKAKACYCPVCKERESQEKKIINQEKIKQQRKQREAEYQKRLEEKFYKFCIQDFKPATLKYCHYCGAAFVNRRNSLCSDECRRKNNNNRHDRRIKSATKKDMTISLKKLYLRDNGTCWICGKKCDFNDCITDNQNNFIVGRNYPSIDHVFPLSKGGSHTWDNVRLAHHYCNTLKNDKVVGAGG